MMKDYDNLVTSVSNDNMTKLKEEVDALVSLGFERGHTVGSGECVFTIGVEMIHFRYGVLTLTIAQSPDDSTTGRAKFVIPPTHPLLRDNYTF